MISILNDIREKLNINIYSVHKVEGGFMNTLSKLDTDIGLLLLKQFSKERYSDKKLKNVENALIYASELYKKGIPTAKIFFIEGKAVRRLEDGSAYCLMSYIEGSTLSAETINRLQLKSLGQALGRIHRELSLMTDKRAEPYEKKSDILIKLWDNYRSHSAVLHKDMQKIYKDTVIKQKFVLDRLCQKRIDDLSVQLCHEDFTSDNIIFSDNEVAAVIDFDRARVSYPLHDVGRALLSFAYSEQKLLYENVEAFMEGYREYLPLTEKDIKDAFMITWCIETLWWIDPPFFETNRGKANRFCEEIVWLTQNPDIFI